MPNINIERSPRAGQVATVHPARSLKPWLLLSPGGLFLVILVIATLMVLRMSFGTLHAEFDTWTLENYVSLTGSLYWKSAIITFRISVLTTVILVFVAFPVALFMARVRSEFIRRIILFLILLPLLINLLLQSYGWLVILGPAGLLNGVLLRLGWIGEPKSFLFNETGVLLGLIQTSFPFAVLPIASALRAIPQSLEEAGATLGANRLRVLWHIVLPLSLPGVVAASVLVFAFNTSAFVVPLLLGGSRVAMLAPVIAELMGPMLDWPLGSANATVLVAISLFTLAIYQRLTRRHA